MQTVFVSGTHPSIPRDEEPSASLPVSLRLSRKRRTQLNFADRVGLRTLKGILELKIHAFGRAYFFYVRVRLGCLLVACFGRNTILLVSRVYLKYKIHEKA